MKIPTILFSICCFFCSLIGAESIGKVIALEGIAEANARALARGAEIFISDVIKVAQESKVQIRFTDGGILNLIEQSEYQIKSYQFNRTASDNFSAELLKGGLRTVTGAISQSNPKGYSVKTPVATIGIRGTLYEVNIIGKKAYFGVTSGTIVLSNRGGVQTLEAGNYLSTSSRSVMGTPTTERPEALNPSYFTPPLGGVVLETVGTPSGLEGGIQLEVQETEGNPPCS